jgi:hypothetical protein
VGKKGGGGGAAPTPQVPQGLKNQNTNLQGLGQYEAQFLNTPLSLGNWATNIATGGFGPQAQAGTDLGRFQTDISGGGMRNYSNPTVYSGGGFGTSSGGWGSSPSGTSGSSSGSGASSGYQFVNGQWQPIPAGQGGQPAAGAGQPAAVPGGPGNWTPYGPTSGSQAGPMLDTFQQSVTGMEKTATNPYPGLDRQSLQNFQDQLNSDANMFGPTGLTSDQTAMIDAQTNAGKTQLATNLGSMGINPNSTQGAALSAELDQQGAAQKGALIDQNMQVKQGFQKLMEGEQTISSAEQQAMFSQFQTIGTMSATEQAQMFNEGLQGYGLMSTFMKSVTDPYSLSLSGYQSELGASVSYMNAEAGLMQSAASSASSGSSDMIGALGSLFGSSGALGGVGSAVGGGLTSAVGAVAGVLACALAREVYGIDNPKWRLFRSWMLFDAPRIVRRNYLKYAPGAARLISKHEALKWICSKIFDLVLWTDLSPRQ